MKRLLAVAVVLSAFAARAQMVQSGGGGGCGTITGSPLTITDNGNTCQLDTNSSGAAADSCPITSAAGSSTVATFSSTVAAGKNAFASNTGAFWCLNSALTCSTYFYDSAGTLTFAAGAGLATMNPSVTFNAIESFASTNPPQIKSTGASTFGIASASGQNLLLSANGLGGQYMLQPPRALSYQINLSADTTFTALGLPAPTIITGGGTCTAAASTAVAGWQEIKYPTDGTVAHECGISGPYTVAIEPTYNPLFYAVVTSDASAVTDTRVYVGLPHSDLSAVSTLAGANAINGCYFRFDSGIGDTDLMAQSSDGTTASATDTTIAYAAATTYVLAIDNTVSGVCDFYINGAKVVHKTTNITTTGTTLGVESGITNITAGAVRALSVSTISVQEH